MRFTMYATCVDCGCKKVERKAVGKMGMCYWYCPVCDKMVMIE